MAYLSSHLLVDDVGSDIILTSSPVDNSLSPRPNPHYEEIPMPSTCRFRIGDCLVDRKVRAGLAEDQKFDFLAV